MVDVQPNAHSRARLLNRAEMAVVYLLLFEFESQLHSVIARSTCDEAIHLTNRRRCEMDCFAEPVIGPRFAPTRWLAMTSLDGRAGKGAFSAPCPPTRCDRDSGHGVKGALPILQFYASNTASAPFTASALSITVRSSDAACTVMFSAKNRASVT
jgi:hypothetical protein